MDLPDLNIQGVSLRVVLNLHDWSLPRGGLRLKTAEMTTIRSGSSLYVTQRKRSPTRFHRLIRTGFTTRLYRNLPPMVTAIRHGCLIGVLMAAVLFRFDSREVVIDVAPETQIDSPVAFVAAEACKYLRHAKGLSLPLIFTIQWRKYALSGAEIPDEEKQVTGVLRSCDPRTEM